MAGGCEVNSLHRFLPNLGPLSLREFRLIYIGKFVFGIKIKAKTGTCIEPSTPRDRRSSFC